MLLHPEAQKRAQDELDRVLGTTCLPTFDDRSRLPYVDAVIAETLRWEPVVPLGVPHATTADDIYNGCFIPAGTAVIPNQWAMLQDPAQYPEPAAFKPERWMPSSADVDGEKALGAVDPKDIAFGFGRRICPGMHLADNGTFIAAASLLAAFDIRKATDMLGRPITPSPVYAGTLIRQLQPFDCAFVPRSDKVEGLVRQNLEDGMQLGT